MPILNIEIVGPEHGGKHTQSLADAAARILDSKPGGTWVKVQFIPESHYAESGELAEGIKPVFVSVLLARCGDQLKLSQMATELSGAFAKILGRPQDNIHILFEPSAVGRIAFGGRMTTTV